MKWLRRSWRSVFPSSANYGWRSHFTGRWRLLRRLDLEAGMVTVEAALGFVAIIGVLALGVGALNVVRVQADLCQAAREGARAEAIGDSGQDTASSSFGGQSTVSISTDGHWVQVDVSASPMVIGGLQVGTLNCQATTLREPNVGSVR